LHELVRAGSPNLGQHVDISKVLEVVSQAGLLYSDERQLYNDMDILSSQDLITIAKAGNAGYLMITIKPNAILAVEKQEESEQEESSVLSRLTVLFDNRNELLKDGPNSEAGIAWFAEVASLLEVVDPRYAENFRDRTQYVTMPLSSYTIEPIWNQILYIVKEALYRLGKDRDSKERVYPAGSQYDLYRDVRTLLQNEKSSVLIVEPYPDEDIFDLYLESIPRQANIRLLVKNTPDKFLKLLGMYKLKLNVLVDTRHSKTIHDRVLIIDDRDVWVLGQSLKDAATTKPTYLVQVNSIDMRSLYEKLWQTSEILK
jgi:hypothetical protein